ncbi:MAG: glycosyltransferase [Candidatus Cloacimonetes bacterium]|nr:glycosyltransferase [Candidatus Cloacimonadota bacterium]MBL7085918.1 glycosyltransferase [Candidatus Cloacimonadota bacterium]
MKKVLIITYYWPPAGGPGVQRVLKFSKYLPEFGWQPIILTVKNGEYPAIDETLKDDIPENCKVYKTKSIEPNLLYKKFTGMKPDKKIPVAVLAEKNLNWKKRLANWMRINLFIPDAKIGWIPYAVRKGKNIIKSQKPDIIFSSSPPPTVHLIAKKLAKWSKIKWVADFRDPWTRIHYYNKKRNKISQWIDNKLENKVITFCNKATCVSTQFPELINIKENVKFDIISNGYDESEMQCKRNKINSFNIIHVGSINISRYYGEFFKIIRKLLNKNRLDRNKIQLLLIGEVEKSIKQMLERELVEFDNIKFIGYVSHQSSINYMYQANILLLFLENVENYEGHIPGKLFEYIATENFILGIGPKYGDAADILEKTKTGKMFEFNEIDGIKKEIEKQYENWEKGIKPEVNKNEIEKYSRRRLTYKLTEIFDSLI